MPSPNWLILVVIALLVLGTALFLYVVLKRARKVSFSPDKNAKPDSGKNKSAPLEFLQYASNLELRLSFRRALRILKTYVTRRDYRYQVPWFLVAGEAQSGKTTLLDSSRLTLISQPGQEDNQLNWYFFDEGIILDAAGDFVLRADGTANHRGWNTISRLLQKHRPRRPLDGIVLTIPANDLMGRGELTPERKSKLERKANALYKKLWQAQKILGMCLPVYVLVTKCDEVTGFKSYCSQLPPRLQTQMLGWSNPYTLETSYHPELVPEAFESLYRYVSRLQFEIYTERDEILDADDLFLFPSSMQEMRAPLQVYLDCLFKQSAYHESYFFRGLYFSGEPAIEAAPEFVAQREEDGWADPLEPFDASLPEASPALSRQPIFLADLFKKKVFCEANLAQPIQKTALSRNRMVLATQALSLAILLIGGGGIAATYRGLARHEAGLHEFLLSEKADLEKVERLRNEHGLRPTDSSYAPVVAGSNSRNVSADLNHAALDNKYKTAASDPAEAQYTPPPNPQSLLNGEAKLLAGMAKMNGNRLYSVFMPSSWFSGINRRLERSVTKAFQYVVFDSLRIDLEKQGNKLLDYTGDHSSQLNPSSYSDQRDPLAGDRWIAPSTRLLQPNFQLHLYVEELGKLRSNLESYDRLIRKDPTALEELRQLGRYLQHADLPPGFDKENELFKQGLTMAEGQPIQTKPLYKEISIRVAEVVEDYYVRSFNGSRDVKYDYLDDISKTQALLSRPEHTWLASFVFDPHSAFHGMTVSSALHELKQALQDLRRQPFMKRDVYSETPRTEPMYQHRVRRVLVWDQEALRRAISLYNQYETFIDTRSYERSEYLDDSVKQATRSRIKVRIRSILARSRTYQPMPTGDGLVMRASLIAELRNLQNVQNDLSKVLEISARLGIDQDIRSALSEQANYMLRGIKREFVSQGFYLPRRDGFSWWDGKQAVSYRVYELGGAEELAAYLALQRKSIAFLSRDLAVPVLTFFGSQSISMEPEYSRFDWQSILSDLDSFDQKTPGNPIGALETFITNDIDQISLETCYSSRLPSASSSGNYFLGIRNSLRLKFFVRCKRLALENALIASREALANYDEIAKSFNENLKQRFPFSHLSQGSNPAELEPWAMLKFFKVLGLREKAAREALERSGKFGAAPGEALAFLDQIASVREFFALFLEKNQGPVFDFRVEFRVDQDKERGASQIIDWNMDVGKKHFAYLG
ncbi:MAG TPA: type VI secretion protein IcmF/TssM N-terminal domain-containing protein, partial [Pyrinomonadaceae bacterium]|nr:type VI secretion protein IcmF/TssM N-terminal domain-containing protein [Pyrinomonadaceae bacterium]